jgi:adenine-specific DNA-methyltransferase
VKEGVTPVTIWPYDEVGHNHEANEELKVLGFEGVFDNPKPTRLLRRILELTTSAEDNDIVLDSFAGSGTTGQAVLELNKEDGGNRHFILVEMEDYADTLTAERLRRVIRGVPDARDAKLREGLGGSFSFFELGKPFDMEKLLEGNDLPTYEEMARYVLYTATGEEFDPARMDEATHFIGETAEYRAYLYYKPDIEYLKMTALDLETIRSLPGEQDKTRLVFAPARYVDPYYLDQYRVKYVQLPYEIFRGF